MTPDYLPFYEALASDTRLSVIHLLCGKDMNVKELAAALGVSSSIMTKHVRKLEEAKIITTNLVKKDGSLQKICTLLNTTYEIDVPFRNNRRDDRKKYHTTNLPVGHFTDLLAEPPCGLASAERVLGDLDSPHHMMSPDRVGAELFWITNGYVEYKVPNYLHKRQQLGELTLSGEFGSEAAGFCDDWPSNIRVLLNGKHICTFTTPGDFGETKGLLTPRWWRNSQYGIMIIIRINHQGVYINGEKRSNICLNDLDSRCDTWIIRFEVERMSKNGGGMTIFGEKFGNYAQALVFKEYYE